ncbi:MAG: GNAT family N-acetyltransferase [bacterium]
MKIQNIKIRKIRRTDLPYFLKWWKDETLIELTSGEYEKSEDVLRGYYIKMLNAQNDRHYAILCGSKIIGNISLIRKNKNIFEISIIIGEKKYWGAGIGQAAIERLLKIAFDKLGYKKAYIEVRPENLRAIKLYKKCGFIEAGFKKDIKNKNQPVVLKMILTKNHWLRKILLVNKAVAVD